MIAAFSSEIICAVVAIILQAVVAPYLAIGFAVPNIALAFAVAFSAASRRTTICIMPFLVGLAYDLLGSGPVGAMALLSLLASIVAVNLVVRFENGTPFVPIAALCIVILGADLLYAVICVTCGWDVGLGEALLTRSLPSWAYDTVMAVILYPLCRFILRPKPDEMDLTSIG